MIKRKNEYKQGIISIRIFEVNPLLLFFYPVVSEVNTGFIENNITSPNAPR